MQQQGGQQQLTLYLVGVRAETRERERHIFQPKGDVTVHLVANDKGDVMSEAEIEPASVTLEITKLLLKGYRFQLLVQDKSLITTLVDWVELFFRVRNATLFYVGLATFTAAYWVIVGISEFYEWGTFVAALILGSLLTRATKISFLGLSIEVEEVTNAIIYQQQTHQAWQQGYQQGHDQGYAAGLQDAGTQDAASS